MTVQSFAISTESIVPIAVLCCALGLPGCGSDEDGDNSDIIVINADNQNIRTNNTSPNSTPNSSTNQTPNGSTNGTPNGATNLGINANCPPEARPVYVVEADVDNPSAQGKLVRFEPQERRFTEIGDLNCPASLGAQPFSMSVDRDATAWVLYGSGELFEVSTTDASCTATSFQEGQGGYDVFGMGFVLNTPTSEEETLYVAGGAGPGTGAQPRIGYVTFPSLTITDVTTIGGWPEMSGTAAAELWAFFPQPLQGGARVSRLVPATGEELDQIAVDSVISGDPNAWAFAHWGGRFYLFYKSQTDPSSSVFEVQKDGSVEEIIPDTGRYIVGAGVSTCAPLIIQ